MIIKTKQEIRIPKNKNNSVKYGFKIPNMERSMDDDDPLLVVALVYFGCGAAAILLTIIWLIIMKSI
jgi:hypothetical protein